MTGPPRLAVLIGAEASLSPAEVVTSAKGIADIVLLLDREEASRQPRLLMVAQALATTEVVDLTDVRACLAAVQRHAASHVTTYADPYCQLVDALATGRATNADRWRKDAQRGVLLDAGLSTATQLPLAPDTAIGQRLGYPLVVKPVCGVASRDVAVATDDAHLRAIVNGLRRRSLDPADFVAERFVVGSPPSQAPYLADYASVELLVGATRTAAFVTDRPPLAWPCRETGIAGPTAVDLDTQRWLIEHAMRAHKAFGLGSGSFHIELKLAGERPEIIEVNGRLGGYVKRLVQYGCGVDLGPTSIRCAVGRDPALDLTWTRYVFGILYQAPAAARRVTVAPRRRDLAGLDGILAVDSVAESGTTVHWRTGSSGAVAKLWLAADTRAEVWRRVRAAADWLDSAFVFVDERGDRVPGTGLTGGRDTSS